MQISEYISKLKSLGNNVKLELGPSSYVAKTNLKKATGVDMSEFAKKTDLTSLKLDVDELDVDKLKKIPVNLSNVVDNDVVKKNCVQ